eukprot:9842265-Lingulodinium_polyedra.AAC.1
MPVANGDYFVVRCQARACGARRCFQARACGARRCQFVLPCARRGGLAQPRGIPIESFGAC